MYYRAWLCKGCHKFRNMLARRAPSIAAVSVVKLCTEVVADTAVTPIIRSENQSNHIQPPA